MLAGDLLDVKGNGGGGCNSVPHLEGRTCYYPHSQAPHRLFIARGEPGHRAIYKRSHLKSHGSKNYAFILSFAFL